MIGKITVWLLYNFFGVCVCVPILAHVEVCMRQVHVHHYVYGALPNKSNNPVKSVLKFVSLRCVLKCDSADDAMAV